jgi:hypothetical protein
MIRKERFIMKKFKKLAMIGMVAMTAVSAMSASAFAAELDFTDTPVYPIDAMNRIGSIHLAENENTINLSCSKVSNENEEYYISVYEKGTPESAYYVVKYLGPIKVSDFKIAGLNSGKDYYVLLSSVGNKQTVSGKIFTSYTEVPSI